MDPHEISIPMKCWKNQPSSTSARNFCITRIADFGQFWPIWAQMCFSFFGHFFPLGHLLEIFSSDIENLNKPAKTDCFLTWDQISSILVVFCRDSSPISNVGASPTAGIRAPCLRAVSTRPNLSNISYYHHHPPWTSQPPFDLSGGGFAIKMSKPEPLLSFEQRSEDKGKLSCQRDSSMKFAIT